MDEPEAQPGPDDETVEQKQHRLFARGRDTGRIEYFTDAVIAIALTLLVLDIRLPEIPKHETLFEAVGAMWEQLFAYVLSFLVIAINWVFHHRRFRAIVRYDSGLVWINLGFLLFIALVPFPTSLLAEYAPDPQAITLYAATVMILGLFGTATWAYAYHAKLMSPAIDDALYRYILGNNLVTPTVFALSIPFVWILAAFGVRTTWALWFWALNWLLGTLYVRFRGRVPAGAVAATIKD